MLAEYSTISNDELQQKNSTSPDMTREKREDGLPLEVAEVNH